MKKIIKYTDEKQNMKVIESYRIILLFFIIKDKFRQNIYSVCDSINKMVIESRWYYYENSKNKFSKKCWNIRWNDI